MKILPSLLLTALVAASAQPGLARPKDPEARLAQALEGRVAGEPVDCIQLRNIRSSRIIDGTAIVYQVGSTLYVNRAEGGQQSLDRDDIMVTDTRSSRLCSIDVVRLYDATARMQTGFVALGPFVPYRRAADADRR
ncbi:hypothetical protein [Sphingosinicella sp. LY1275]|uniref:hypothetical protein n=1 Tax=Sphingosinicella sp. LY1275 TaxID=3095379 RepID=UPI002ADEE27D|nr:hypothetical protein [Sphingosinicella sp. LY1275]MEA1014766.1 hypothetical protein [Sphingosinicella sp. LY1275]